MTEPKASGRYTTLLRAIGHEGYSGACRRRRLTGGVIGLCVNPEHHPKGQYVPLPKASEPRIKAGICQTCGSGGILDPALHRCVKDESGPRILAECWTCRVWEGSPFYNLGDAGTYLDTRFGTRTFALLGVTLNGCRRKDHDVRPVEVKP